MKRINLGEMITKILLSIIFVLISSIYIKCSNENKLNYQKIFINTSIPFTKINNLYNKYLGDIIPNFQVDLKSSVSNIDDLEYVDSYLNGSILKVNNSYVSALSSGMVVFIGEKQGYNKVIIIQGNDGVDITYGNIDNTNLNIYDYVKKGDVISTVKDSTLYLVLLKDNNYLKYEEYKS